MDSVQRPRGGGIMEFGEPISTEQFCWFVLKEIKSPVVGDLSVHSSPGYALAYCKKDEVWHCLSSGEKRLVDIAHAFWSNTNPQGSEGLIALSGLARALRRKVWVAIGYLILGRDLIKTDHRDVIDWNRYKGSIPHEAPL